ncbi:hypothetical protein DL767_011480 [Monosporascus sp. MG133]|nr:hypothetical protein DL767_011480 [Monosporascus sp. MG133]
MLHASLDQAEPFFAVSYAWGDPQHTCKLICDGAEVWVPENTFRTLFMIYHAVQRSSTGRYQAKRRQSPIWLARGGRGSDVSGVEKAVKVDSWRVLKSNRERDAARLNLVDLLLRTRPGKATDLRDNVYSLLGTMEEDRAAIRVDYSESRAVAHVFRDVAKNCMASTDGPNPPHACRDGSDPPGPADVGAGLGGEAQGAVESWFIQCLRKPVPPHQSAPRWEANQRPGHQGRVDVVDTNGLPMSYPEGILRTSTGENRRWGPGHFGVVFSAAIVCERAGEKHTSYPLRQEEWFDVIWRTCNMDRSWAGGRRTARDRSSFEAPQRRHDFGHDIFEAVRADRSAVDGPTLSSRHLVDPVIREAALPFELMLHGIMESEWVQATVNAEQMDEFVIQ